MRLLPHERLRLASLILNELANTPGAIDSSTEWNEQDQQDVARFALAYAADEHDKQQSEF